MKHIRLVIFMIISNVSFGQNLVPNPGFEEFYTCPKSHNTNKTNNKIAPHWFSPSYGTPDLYNTCSHSMGVQNITGVTNPYAGKGFVGIIIWEKEKGFREYLQVKLLEPLQAEHMYVISFRYKLSSYSKYSVDRIGFSLSQSSENFKHDGVIDLVPIYSTIKPKAIDPYTGSWELIETEFKAKGGETYLTIGNFYDNKETKAIHLPFVSSQESMLQNASYYYIDEVSVLEKNPIENTTEEKAIASLNDQEIKLSNAYTLENVLFEFNSATLLSGSFNQLKEVISILNKFAQWKIQIIGYTDMSGTDEYNLILSEKRANSVKQYLISHGISKDRIESKGMGENKLITNNTDSDHQKINRRVEVRFYETKPK